MEQTTATAAQPEYLTVAEVSSRFRVSVPTISAAVRMGRCRTSASVATGPIRIPASQLEQLYDRGVSDDRSFLDRDSLAGSRMPTARPLKVGHETTRSGVTDCHLSGLRVTN